MIHPEHDDMNILAFVHEISSTARKGLAVDTRKGKGHQYAVGPGMDDLFSRKKSRNKDYAYVCIDLEETFKW